MANRKLATSFLPISVSDQSTEQANFPATNVTNRKSPQIHWRSTNTTQQNIAFDLGDPQRDLTVYIDWCNTNSIRYQESPDGLGSWTNIGSSSFLTVSKDPIHGVYRRRDEITLDSNQFLRILIEADSATDGAPYFRIGTVCIPTNVIELDADTTVEYPYDVTLPSSHIVENRFPTGISEKIKLGQSQPMVISFALRTAVHQNLKGDSVEELGDLLRDPTQTLYLDFNLGESWQAYLVKKSGDLRASLNTPSVGTADFGSVLFDVVV